MAQLDPADLAALRERVSLAIALYERQRALDPSWPDEETRRRDFEDHLRVKALLDRAPHVGAR